VPAEFILAPAAQNVVEYVYQINDEPEQTVAAAADGTGTITYTPTVPGGSLRVVARSRQADGTLSEALDFTFYIPSGE